MSKRSRPKRNSAGVSRARAPRPAIPAIPSPRKPLRYRLVVVREVFDTATDWHLESQTLVEGGPLAMCEEQGMRAANYGVFRLCEDGTREWYRPTRIVIEPVKDEEVVGG
jgi:hypothetical protein